MTDNNNLTFCPKCKNGMVEGFLPDYAYGSILESTWVPGEPVKSFWMRTKIRKKEKLRLQAYRCTKCGYIELFAKSQTNDL